MILLPSIAPAAAPTPEDAFAAMRVAEGCTVGLVAHEPVIRQPVAVEFDDRGRPWVIQYLQFPNSAGLERVAVDRYSRTEYDRVPEPPPHGPRGADRITILADEDGDGRYESGTDFTDGLNHATGIAFGDGGVYVLNVPYLLFYPDRDRDDRPDGDPEVLLSGFGMQDAHSVANSLVFGPDGWLYGCQGSTVTARIRGIEFQQGVWRYHPPSRRFELFCEGGRQLLGARLRPPRRAALRYQSGRACPRPRSPGGVVREGVRQARPAPQPLRLRLARPRPRREFSGGPRDRRRDRGTGHDAAGMAPRPIRRRRPPRPRRALARPRRRRLRDPDPQRRRAP
jgi:hypothetical protein